MAKPKAGRPRVPDRAALGGVLFVLRTGAPWRLLPGQLSCGGGPTCRRRLRDSLVSYGLVFIVPWLAG